MKMMGTLAAVTVLMASQQALATSSAWIEGHAGSFEIHAGSLNVLGNSGHGFYNDDLYSVHQQLNADGIDTNQRVTILLAQTDAGLTLMSLVDRQWDDHNAYGSQNAKLDVWSNAQTEDYFVNGTNEDIDFDTDPDHTSADGRFKWNSKGDGDALAWAGLEDGDHGDFKFKKVWGHSTGLKSSHQFQFISWNGDKWMKVASGSFDWHKKFKFEFWVHGMEVVPVPPAAALGLAGLAGIGVLRRRKK